MCDIQSWKWYLTNQYLIIKSHLITQFNQIYEFSSQTIQQYLYGGCWYVMVILGTNGIKLIIVKNLSRSRETSYLLCDIIENYISYLFNSIKKIIYLVRIIILTNVHIKQGSINSLEEIEPIWGITKEQLRKNSIRKFY